MKREFLTDRIAINFVDTDKFKSNFLSVSFVVPFDKRNCATNALILKILKRGTKSYPNMIALSKKLEYLYSADIFTKQTSFGEIQLLNFSVDVLNDTFALEDISILKETMKILGELIFSPVTENGMFLSDYFESEKRNLLDDIAADINNKGKYALKRMCEHMFEEENFSFLFTGDPEAVKMLTNQEVYAHYLSILNSANIEISFVGNTNYEEFKKALMETLAPYAPKNKLEYKTNVVRSADKVKEIHETCTGKQGNLVLGFRTGTVLSDGDYPKMALLSELYGGSASSLLFMNVREKRSLCYYCAAIPEAIKGIMLVRAGIENKNFEIARDAILEQLDNIRNGSFDIEELDAARLSLINAYREISDNPQALQNWYIGRALSGITQSPDEVIEIVKTISKEEIMATAKKITLDTVYFLEGVIDGGNN